MTYDPNIPQAADLLSVSQNDLLINFQQLNVVYGTEHFAFDDGTPNATQHRRITMPSIAAPASAAGVGTMWNFSLGPVDTWPYYRHDGIVTQNWPVIALKAFGEFSVPGAVLTGDSVNITNVVRNAAGTYTVTFINPMINTNYSVLLSPVIRNPPHGGGALISYRNKAVNQFQIILQRQDGTALLDDNITNISFAVLRA